jgi:predicted amidohydrolase
MKKTAGHGCAYRYIVLLLVIGVASCAAQAALPLQTAKKRIVRVCAAQPTTQYISWRLTPEDALAGVAATLRDLEQLVHLAGTDGCDVLALPEDTLGLLHWEAANKSEMKQVLPKAVDRMLDRLGKAAESHRMYIVCSSDTVKQDGTYRNTAFLLNRNGQEIGRYYNVQPTINESDRVRGMSFPVFKTPDLGWVGLLICSDMMFPESTRALALAGADIIFDSSLGGAVYAGGTDMDRAAFRTRAVDNFVYLVVAKRGSGEMIISPLGKVLAEGKEPNSIAVADIDPFGGRAAGDAANFQVDMRARLFRERNPAAYAILTEPNPPVLKKVPATITVEQAVRIWDKMLTTGEERFDEAEALYQEGKIARAVAIYKQLRTELPSTWIDRVAQKRLANVVLGNEARKTRSNNNDIVVRPNEIDTVLVNPGVGTETFQRFNGDTLNTGLKWSEAGPTTVVNPAAAKPDFPESSIAYCRWFWNVLEPQHGHFNWKIIDDALDQAREHHQTLAIRMMPYDEGHPLPEWYRNSGARRVNKPSDPDGKIWQPDFSDPLYLKYWGQLVAAAGARYDGNPYLEMVDISSIGYWGEGWSHYMPPFKYQKPLIEIYLKAFKRTPLLMNFDQRRALSYGTSHGAGWRLDCWGDMGRPWWGEMLDIYPEQVVRAGIENVW